MRKFPFTTLLTGILTATASALAVVRLPAALKRKESKPAEISGLTTLVHLGPDGAIAREEDVSSPLFPPGSEVIAVNPYTHEFAIEDLDGTPLYYEVLSVEWDDADRTWRYMLNGESPDEGFAEAWLSKPPHPMMTKEWIESFAQELKEAEKMHEQYDEWGEAYHGLGEAAARRRKEKAKEAEEDRKYKVDAYLDLYNNGGEAEKAVALERLAELQGETKEGGK